MLDEIKNRNIAILLASATAAWTSGFFGFATGMVLSDKLPDQAFEIKSYPAQRDLPSVIRVYRALAADDIYVALPVEITSTGNPTSYIGLGRYLHSLSEEESERRIREAEILQLVKWYDE